MSMTEPTETPAKPKRRKAKPRKPAAPKPPSIFTGITPKGCPTACTPERCVISTIGVCKHPFTTGANGCGPITLENREAAKKLLGKQKIDLKTH